jgi:Amidohydrolase family
MRVRSFGKILPVLLATFAVIAIWMGAARHARAAEPRYFAIRGARIVPVSGAPIDNGTVVVANGLIAAVGANAAIPPEAEVLDGSGLTVYPGFIDAGTDVGLETTATAQPAGRGGGGGGGGRGAAANAPLSRGPEDRPATTPWVSAADEIHAGDRRIESWRDAGFTTGLVLPQAGIFPGQGALVDFADADSDRGGSLVVKSNVALPINFNGGRGLYQGFPSALMGDLSYVHQVFIDAQWYADAMKVYSAHPQGLERPEYDRTDVVIGHVLANKELVLVPGNSDVDILRALKLAPEWNANWALWGAQQGYEVPSQIAAAKVPVIVDVDWPTRPAGIDAYAEEHESLRTLQFRDRAPGSPAALVKNGVKIAFSSGGASNASDIIRNVNKSIAAGLAPDAALRALTIDAAQILGAADRLGTIEPGKIANLVVTNGDIFKDGTAIKWVFVDGQRFEVRTPLPAPAGRAGGGGGGGQPGGAAGHWHIVVDTGQGNQEADLDLDVSEAGAITGSVATSFGNATITRGSVNGNSVNFTFKLDVGEGPEDIVASGTIEGNRISGTIGATGNAFPFTGTRPRQSSEAEVR